MLPTHLNIQIDVLRDKMCMDVAPYQEEKNPQNSHYTFLKVRKPATLWSK